MPYVVVLLVATAAGAAVGYMTLRGGRVAPANPEAWTEGYSGGTPREGAPTDARARRRLPPDPNPHTRKIGAAGLIGVILGAAGVIALVAYLVWRVLDGLFNVPQA